MKNIMIVRLRSFLEKYPLGFFSLAAVLQYREILFFNKKIGWDTLDAIFPHFLFMVDAFKNLSIPYYNPLIQGGFSFGENFFTAFLINPIDILLAIFSTFLPPLFVFQLQFPILAALSGYWVYRFFYKINDDQLYALLGGFCYFTSMLFPVAGQLPFFYAFSLLAFLLYPLNEMLATRSFIKAIVALILFITLLIKTYYFFIPFFLILGFVVSVKYYRLSLFKVSLIYGLASVLYLTMTLPVLVYLKSSMADLYGTFVSPEPRLRSLFPEKVLYHNSINEAFADIIDNRILTGKGFTRGLNLGLIFFFIIQLFLMLAKKRITYDKIILVIGMVVAVFFSTGSLGSLHTSIPLIKTFRWGFSYIHFAQLFLLFFIFCYPIKIKELNKSDRLLISGLYVLLFVWIIFTAENLKYLTVAPAIIIMVGFLFYKEEWLIPGAFLFCFVYMLKGVGFNQVRDNSEREQIANRKSEISIVENKREPGKFGSYEWEDRSWLYLKKPTMNGYNNSIHPIFWYLKGHSETAKIVIPLCVSNKLKLKERKDYPENDNQYLKMFRNDIVDLISIHACSENISEIKFTVDKLSFKAVSLQTLILQNMNSFLLKNQDILSEQVLPGGIRIVQSEIGTQVTYEFKKNTWIKNIVFNSILLGFLICYSLFALVKKISLKKTI